MSEPRQPKPTHSLLRDMIGELSGSAPANVNRSLGVVGPTPSLSHPPAHCLRACLDGDPARLDTSGCPWLRSAARGCLDAAQLENGRCPRGFHARGTEVRLNGSTGFLLAIEDAPTGTSGHPGMNPLHDHMLERLEPLSRVFAQVGQLLDENEGLAEEVLRRYEQLNLIFDFTQKIASLTDIEAIERTLLVGLAEFLNARTMLTVGPGGDHRRYDVSDSDWAPASGVAALLKHLAPEIERVRQSRSTSVHSCDTARTVLSPLTRLDDRIEVVLAIRPPEAGEFTSGDMLMVESVLTFGGQIISNNEIHERLRRMSFESTRALVAAIDKKDHYTCGHSERVGFLARMTGERLGIPPTGLQVLEMAALLHDVGKIGVPEEILCKPGRLTEEEFAVIRKHPEMGYEILKPIASFGGVLDGVLYHHENTDGSGYPKGLAGQEIPLFARIMHVVDVFDALTSDRSYRAAYSLERAIEIIREEAGTKLDAEVAAVFIEMVLAYRAEYADVFKAMFPCACKVSYAEA